jgi:hypothetical protein
MVTVGVDKYPPLTEIGVMEVTAPETTVAVAVAAEGALTVTVGATV